MRVVWRRNKIRTMASPKPSFGCKAPWKKGRKEGRKEGRKKTQTENTMA